MVAKDNPQLVEAIIATNNPMFSEYTHTNKTLQVMVHTHIDPKHGQYR